MLWNYLKNKMQENPSQIVCEGDCKMTYAEVIGFVDKFRKELKGTKCCAIMCESEMVAGLVLLSCFAAKVTALPLSVRYGKHHCSKILQSISPDVVITDEDGDLKITSVLDSGFIEPEIKPALIMCTSGTTGNPKGAMLSEKNILTNVTDIASYFKIGKSDTILIARPLYHCAVLTGEFLTSLIKGVKIRFYSGEFSPIKTLKMIDDYSITAFCGTPTLLSMMARFKRTSNNCLYHICISGECMGIETAKRIVESFPDANIYNIYGLTEACPRVAYLPPKLFQKHADCVGLPLDSVSIKIILDNGRIAKPNEVGVLWVKGDNVMLGYYNDHERTYEVLKDGWLCTGDLALIDDNGLLKIKGRNDDLIIKAGMNIYPQEIENALKSDYRVKEVLVYSENDEKLGVQIAMNIVGDFTDIREVKELCYIYLPAYQIPVKIKILDELPKNGSGKVIRG